MRINFLETYNYIKENRGHDAEEMVFDNLNLRKQVLAKACELYGIPSVQINNLEFKHIDLGKRLNLDLDSDDIWTSGTERARLFSDYAFKLGDKVYGISIKGNTGNVSLVSASIKKKQELLFKLLNFKNNEAKNKFNQWLQSDNWDPLYLGLVRKFMHFNKDEVMKAVRGLLYTGTPYVTITIDLESQTIIPDACYISTPKTLGNLRCDDERIFWSPTYERLINECTISVYSDGNIFEKIDFRIRYKQNHELRIELDPKF